MSAPSRDYHDYVFRNGELIGDFEGMYRHSASVPWHQDQQDDWVDVRLTAEMMRGLGKFTEIHDLGCGLGYYLALACERLGAPQCRGFGYDVSPTACAKARELFPQFAFEELDLTRSPGRRPQSDSAPRLFVIRGTLWYVFDHMPEVIECIRGMMRADELLLVDQNFPPLDSNFIGKQVIPDERALIGHFSRRFRLVRSVWYRDTVATANDNWFIGLFSPEGSNE